MRRKHHRRYQGLFTRLASLARSLTSPASAGLVLVFAVPLVIMPMPAQAQATAPGLGNLTYGEGELWQPIATLRAPRTPRNMGYARAFMAGGYLNLIWARDDIGAGIDVWDVSVPRDPVLHRTWNDDRLREAHGLGLWNRDGRIVLAAQSQEGVAFYDVTDVGERLPLLAELDLPGVGSADYGGAWWLSVQAPHVYVATIGGGLHVVDATDPTAPRQVNHLPTGALGGISPGNVYALGNLLVLAEVDSARGFATMDISDPVNPVLLETTNGAAGYSHLFTAGLLLSSGNRLNANRMYVHRVDHDGGIRYVGEAGENLGEGGYGSYQDGYFLSGFIEAGREVHHRSAGAGRRGHVRHRPARRGLGAAARQPDSGQRRQERRNGADSASGRAGHHGPGGGLAASGGQRDRPRAHHPNRGLPVRRGGRRVADARQLPGPRPRPRRGGGATERQPEQRELLAGRAARAVDHLRGGGVQPRRPRGQRRRLRGLDVHHAGRGDGRSGADLQPRPPGAGRGRCRDDLCAGVDRARADRPHVGLRRRGAGGAAGDARGGLHVPRAGPLPGHPAGLQRPRREPVQRRADRACAGDRRRAGVVELHRHHRDPGRRQPLPRLLDL